MLSDRTTLPTGQATTSVLDPEDTPRFTPGQRPVPQAKPRLGFTVAEVAEILDLHPNTVYAWIKKGELPAIQRSRTYYVPRTNLYALLDDLESAGVVS